MVFLSAVSRSEQSCEGVVLDEICVKNVSEVPFWGKAPFPVTGQNNQNGRINPACHLVPNTAETAWANGTGLYQQA